MANNGLIYTLIESHNRDENAHSMKSGSSTGSSSGSNLFYIPDVSSSIIIKDIDSYTDTTKVFTFSNLNKVWSAGTSYLCPETALYTVIIAPDSFGESNGKNINGVYYKLYLNNIFINGNFFNVKVNPVSMSNFKLSTYAVKNDILHLASFVSTDAAIGASGFSIDKTGFALYYNKLKAVTI